MVPAGLISKKLFSAIFTSSNSSLPGSARDIKSEIRNSLSETIKSEVKLTPSSAGITSTKNDEGAEFPAPSIGNF